MRMIDNPVARRSGLVVQEMENEVLVYDVARNRAHCLNETAASVWRECNGKRTPEQIAEGLETQMGVTVPVELVWLAIEQFADSELLENTEFRRTTKRSRREAIKTIGLATMISLPVVASLVAPPNALSSSSCVCTSPAACATQTSCPSTTNCNGLGVCSP